MEKINNISTKYKNTQLPLQYTNIFDIPISTVDIGDCTLLIALVLDPTMYRRENSIRIIEESIKLLINLGASYKKTQILEGSIEYTPYQCAMINKNLSICIRDMLNDETI